jgi:photosystem II stability/assembly factor-like uncharacterized protein
MPASPLSALKWRCIGPHRGGRSVAVAGDPTDPAVYYFGTTGGGVWKSIDGGAFWTNISDGFFQRASVGALAVAPSDPNVIYAGMGETTIRGNVSHGDGVYKSTDAGKTWTHLGLAETRGIGKVRVDPRNPDVVFVAAFGHAHGPNPERGLYRSTNGGKTWDLVLHRSDDAGANDLSIDPLNPRNVYVSFWEARRSPHDLVSGGPGCGLWKSTDGGDTWTDLTDKPGMPKGLKGKIAVSVSPARADRIYIMVEHEDGGVFRSDDGGESWVRLSEDRTLRQRAWYYSHIIADPGDADTVWVLNVEMYRSIDAGKTFQCVPAPHGDNHDLWIDPANPRRIILGNDGGATISINGGVSWSEQYNQPTAEFYHVTADNRTPYRVYGSQQDNTSMSVASYASSGMITRVDWYDVGGGEAGYIQVDPRNANIVYAGEYQGYMTRYDHAQRQARSISVWPEDYSGHGAEDYTYRFQWTYPILISPHDADTVYCGGNHVFKTTNEGQSWAAISPDLTRNDPSKLGPSGGPITKDNTGAEIYCTVFAIAESPKQAGLIWAGTDDGLVHVTTDGGANWAKVTPPDLPEWALISIIEASPHDANTAYVAANRYKHDDFAPYIYKTTDLGKTWKKIVGGIRGDDFLRVVREDPVRKGMLYCGTETGIYVSWDDGIAWHRLGGNFPVVPVHDLIIHADDIVVGTHGRSFWILDDVTLLRQLGAPEVHGATAALYAPKDTYRYGSTVAFGHAPVEGINYWFAGTQVPGYRYSKDSDGVATIAPLNAGENPPDGVAVSYWLAEEQASPIELVFLDANGGEIRRIKSKAKPAEKKEPAFPPKSDAAEDDGPFCPAKAGLNRFVWDMRLPDATKIAEKGGDQPGRSGPRVVPGAYRVRLEAGGTVAEQPFRIVQDPRQTASQADLEAQFALGKQIHAHHDRLNIGINTIRSLRKQAIMWLGQAEGTSSAEAITAAGKALNDAITAIEEALMQTKIQSSQDSLNYPIRLNAKLAMIGWNVGGADFRPTDQMSAAYASLAKQIDEQLAKLDGVLKTEVSAFDAAVAAANLGGLKLPQA